MAKGRGAVYFDSSNLKYDGNMSTKDVEIANRNKWAYSLIKLATFLKNCKPLTLNFRHVYPLMYAKKF